MFTRLRFLLLAVLLTLGLQVPAVALHGDNPAPDGSVPPTGHPYGDPARQGIRLVAPVIGHAHVARNNGAYWMAASDGGVFSYGVPFYGSTYDLGIPWLNAPVFRIIAFDPYGARPGYWLFAEDGGVFSFNAPFYGSAVGQVPAGAEVNYAGLNPGIAGYDMADTVGNIWRCQGTCALINPPLRTPAPPAPARPTVCGHGPGDGRIGWDDVAFLNAVNQYVRPEFHCKLLQVANCESGWDQYAENSRSSASGYMQFLAGWWNGSYPGDWTDPVWQARATQYLLDHGGWSHWECA